MWRARLYYDTGFNTINVPDSEATLLAASGNVRTFSTMDILQRYFLTKVTIRAFEDDVITADYLKIYDENNENKYAFYSINGYTMTSGDVIDLAVVMDPLLSCGGIENIDFTDGMTRRHHVSIDPYGYYQEDDPMLIPRKVYCAQAGGYGDITDDMVVIAVSNYEIYDTSEITCNQNRHLNIISDGNDNWTVSSQLTPGHPNLNDAPIFNIEPKLLSKSGTEVETYTPFGINNPLAGPINAYGDVYHVFNCSKTDNVAVDHLGYFMDKVNELIEYGRSNIIKSIFLVPMRLCVSQGYNGAIIPAKQGDWVGAQENENEDGPFQKITHNILTHITFDNSHKSSSYRDSYDASYTQLMYIDQDYDNGDGDSDLYGEEEIFNKRVFYGKHFAYTFMSPTSGEKCTINPELLTDHPDVDPRYSPQDNLPYIVFTVDIRENGKPTFYIYTEGDDNVTLPETESTTSVYRRVPKYKINGSTWPNMSISTIAARNYELNRNNYQFNAEASALQSAMQMYYDDNPFKDTTMLTAIPQTIQEYNRANRVYDADELIGAYVGAQSRMGFATPILNTEAIDAATAGNSVALNIANREIEKASEREQFISANLPNVEVISRSTGDGIVTPNCLLIYRNYIDPGDAKKFDRILNQFGYKITEPMRKDFLGNRLNYNYVEVSGASVVANNIPKSVRKDLANLFSTGVRIWHTKPDYNYYKENPVNFDFNTREVNNND